MNPFHVQRLIRSSQERYCIPALRQIFDKQLQYSDLTVSDTPKENSCPFTGTVCHYVKGVSPRGWITLWFR